MSYSFFDTVEKEKEPMYDAAIITESGSQYWHNPLCNNANNSHSVTKFFMATAVGILEKSGRLNRTDSVTSFFSSSEMPDGYDKKWDSVSVEHAMQHKTGIDTIPFGVDEDNDIAAIGSDFLKYVFSLPVERQTGVFRRYSDAAYYLISRIIAKASGESTEEFLAKSIMRPLGFRQWAMAKCPYGFPIGGGGFFARADDIAKLGYAYACGGDYNGKTIVDPEWVRDAMERDYACARFRDTDIFVKTGAFGQMVAFSQQKKAAAAWHGYSISGNDRNDRLLEEFALFLENEV
ncbi:MAG: beta-lactamase family protein [Clostridiales bacterium]|nr:beta-lactamase family protein [Clostridiales bacterium]